MELGAKNSTLTEDLLDNLFRACRHYQVDFQGFNLALHTDQLELGVAEEHDYYYYTGSMWVDAYTQEDVWKFVSRVRGRLEDELPKYSFH